MYCHCSLSGPDLICKWAERNKTSLGQYKKSNELKDLNLSQLNAMDCVLLTKPKIMFSIKS